MSRFLVFGCVLLAPLVLSGCSDDFEPRTLLNSYAVLGVELSPPEVGVNDALQVSVHEFIPQGTASTYRWSLCTYSLGPGVGYQCASGAPEVSLGREAEFSLNLGPEGIDLSALLKEQGARSYADGSVRNLERGIDVWLKLSSGPVGESNCDGCRAIDSVKRLTIREKSTQLPNANPVIGELRIEGELLVGHTVEVSIGSNTPEEYVVPRNGEPQTEEYLYTWYTTAGETQPSLTFGATQHTALQLPNEAGVIELVVAVRDGRGGLAVARRVVDVQEVAE